MRDRERIAVDEGIFRDGRLQSLEMELASLKIDRGRLQEELALDRSKCADLSAQLQTSSYKVQSLTTQAEQIDGLNRTIAHLREENLRLQDVDTHFRVGKQHNLE